MYPPYIIPDRATYGKVAATALWMASPAFRKSPEEEKTV